MRMKSCRSGVRMRILLVFLVGAERFTCSQSIAAFLPEMQYNRVLNVCQDKLAVWGNISKAEGALASAPSDNSDSVAADYPFGIFMRGRWKQGSGHSADVVRPSFLSSIQGKFDFFSSQWLRSRAAGRIIQNITASILFFTDNSHAGPLLQASGVYDSETGEVCLVGCLQKPSPPTTTDTHGADTVSNTTQNAHEDVGPTIYNPVYEELSQDCSISGLLTISEISTTGRLSAKGILESLKSSNESDYFTSISLTGSMVNNLDQQALYHVEVLVISLLFAIEAVIVIWQIVHSSRSSAGYFVSILMILFQIVVMFFLAVRLIYVPLRLITYRNFKHLVSTFAVVPLLTLLFVIFINFLFLLVILRKRRIAKRMNVEERPQELCLASVCITIYAAIGALLWSVRNFETYLQLVWCWFLLPQVVANVFWDLRMKPLHWIYLVGVSLCRILYVGFNSLRPTIYGYDDLNDFPKSWFSGIIFTVLFFASYALLQQRYGGRSFLPQRWFGYQQLADLSANQEHPSAKAEERMLDL